ncbi:MBL fold metallo-hydrolase [Archangium primigenium]|uniref:MBL fold metallo-hydrolase n=1 Tax=[Archangium] primigenium TaxID=2792470 RepID=UPI001956A060|nr:MBL fold metallo-hydrolase [Archangium primigenium]MBM7119098.1 MBL fold metallo-hydrolase [Archangium primigenium]
MPIHLCRACGTSYDAPQAPEHCPICVDERQYVPRSGQAWTTPEALAAGHVNAWRQLEPGLFELHTRPDFAIGQRALLIRTPRGNILWDCLALLDAATETLLRALGGLTAIAISHPHYYTRMQDWARAFQVPVHLHAADRAWVMRPDASLRFWEGETLTLEEGVTLLRLGGHFAGGTVLHWREGADGRGALLSGDIVQVAADTRRVSFLWSYPNMMPLSARTVRRIADTLQPWRFERVYGAFPGREVTREGSAAVQQSAARYIELLAEEASP